MVILMPSLNRSRKWKIKRLKNFLKELQDIVSSLESGKLSLEESVEKYQSGMAISLECKKRLDQAKEVVVKKVTENGETDF